MCTSEIRCTQGRCRFLAINTPINRSLQYIRAVIQLLYAKATPHKAHIASVNTLKQGYPFLLYEDAVPTRLSLVAW
jgi:hypothetical protein